MTSIQGYVSLICAYVLTCRSSSALWSVYVGEQQFTESTRWQFDQGLPPNPSLILWLLAVYCERVFSDAAIAHENAISRSLDGRSVLDDMPRQLSLF